MAAEVQGRRPRVGRPTSLEAEQLTDQVRHAAAEAFLQHGYDGTTMEAVAQAAGVTKSTLYARYPDKRALFLAVSGWALTRMQRDGNLPERLPDDLAESLAVIARSIVARSVDPEVARWSRMAIAESQRFPEFAVSSQTVTWSPSIAVIMDLLRRHQQAGSVAVADAGLAAEQFFAMVGTLPAWLATYGIHRPPEEEERHVQHAVSLFLNGVLARDDPGQDVLSPDGLAAAGTGMAAGAGRGACALPDRRQLGHSGLYVSPLALGAAALCRAGQGTEDQAAALVRRFLDAGGNLIDASSGESAEIACGHALGSRRPDAVLAAAAGMPAGGRGSEGGNGRRRIREACEASLRRLRTDYIDLYQVQADDLATPLEETVSALDDLVRAGKVLYTGASGLPAYRLMKALSASDRLGRARFISFRGPYGITARGLEREHFPLLAEEGLGFISAGPLSRPGDTAAAAAVERAAGELGCTPWQLELAWQRTRAVTSVITDADSTARLEDSMTALSIEVPAAVAALLEHPGPMPHGQ